MSAALSPAVMEVLEGIEIPEGQVNVPEETILANIASAIRRGLPQVWQQRPNPSVVCLVGGGPSLIATEHELRDLSFDPNVEVVTVNGAYRWCIDRNIRPSAQVVVDARASNARFLDPYVPECRYYLASQAHPDAFDRVMDRRWVGLFHAVGGSDEDDTAAKQLLHDYYLGRWQGVAGGSTVTTRAIGLLRMMGYLRFHLFGVDSCWMDGLHHAYAQPENEHDRRYRVSMSPSGHEDRAREFFCAPWHVKQFQDLLRFIRLSGDSFLLNVHGTGLLAHALTDAAEVARIEEL